MEKIKANNEFRNKILEEINKCRCNPEHYADKIKRLIKYFNGKILNFPKREGLITNEGSNAFKEAANFLETASPLEPFEYNPSLSHISHDILVKIKRYEDINKAKSIDLTNLIKKKYSNNVNDVNFTVDFGNNSHELLVANLLVNDGEKDRKIRNVFFNEEFVEIGISTGDHNTYDHATIIIFGKKCKKKFEYNNNHEDDSSSEGDYIDEDFNLPEGINRITKEEKEVIEDGKVKRLIKITEFHPDGTQKVSILMEN